jgi:hypothetical protein
MRQRHAFLITLIADEAEPTVLRGRVRHVASETETAFTGAEQLIAFLHAQGFAAAAKPPATRAPEASQPAQHTSQTTG